MGGYEEGKPLGWRLKELENKRQEKPLTYNGSKQRSWTQISLPLGNTLWDFALLDRASMKEDIVAFLDFAAVPWCTPY